MPTFFVRLFKRCRTFIWHSVVYPIQCRWAFARARRAGPQAAVFIGVPAHGNLGDQAIVLGQTALLASLGMAGRIVEIPGWAYPHHSRLIDRLVRPEDLLFIEGGGSMGTLWPKEQERMKRVVAAFPNNPIIIFPQTLYYDSSADARAELALTQRLFGGHPNLVMFAREAGSYQLMKEYYANNRVYLVPDVVLYLQGLQWKGPREHIFLCMRPDHERILADGDREQLEEFLHKAGRPIQYHTNDIGKTVLPHQREQRVKQVWQEIASARLVVTDRLHAMVFAAINGTPCIAFNNISGKVGNVYRWIEDLEYVQLVDSVAQAEIWAARFLQDSQAYTYSNDCLKEKFEPLIHTIEGYSAT